MTPEVKERPQRKERKFFTNGKRVSGRNVGEVVCVFTLKLTLSGSFVVLSCCFCSAFVCCFKFTVQDRL